MTPMTRVLNLLLLASLLPLAGDIHAAAAAEELPFPQALAAQGEARFAATCGFCHGLDAAGGSRGFDLVRSDLVAADVDGNLIGPVVRSGRPNTDMAAFNTSVVSADDLTAIVAFLHNQRVKFASLEGGRRSVLPEDVAIGNADAGKAYFGTHCTACHDKGDGFRREFVL